MLSLITSLFAGMLATLSPCVLPVLPIMAGSSMQKNKSGPLVLAAGLIFSFTVLGVVFSSTVSILGLTEAQVRFFSASLLVVFGLVLVSTVLKSKLSGFSSPLSNFAHDLSHKLENRGLVGQFGIGSLLGAAWGPCVGPTLGIAMGLASNQDTRTQAVIMMAAFGIGMSVPFLAIAYGFRNFLMRQRSKLIDLNRYAMPALGVMLALTGGMMLLGVDKKVEASIVNVLPATFFEYINSI